MDDKTHLVQNQSIEQTECERKTLKEVGWRGEQGKGKKDVTFSEAWTLKREKGRSREERPKMSEGDKRRFALVGYL